MSGLKTFPQAPYFDDFAEDKNFLRVMVRPGYAVQTRELNQMQTILQNQIGNLSDYFFENGYRVLNGDARLDNAMGFIKLTGGFSREPQEYAGRTISNASGTLRATIVEAVPTKNGNPNTFYVKYLGTDTVDNVTSKFGNTNILTVTLEDESIENFVTASVDATGITSYVQQSAGVFYINSSFFYVPAQGVAVTDYAPTTSGTHALGLQVTHELITAEDDISLLDNASGTTNESAPGADRYRISASLVRQEQAVDVENYIKVITIIDGEIVFKARNTEASVLEQALAQRTFDESGNYTVTPFKLTVKENKNTGTNGGVYLDGNPSLLTYVLDRGEAYVRGYQVKTLGNTFIDVPKARTIETSMNILAPLQFQSEFYVSGFTGSSMELGKNVNLKDISSVIIGTAVVRAMHTTTTAIAVEVINVKLNAGKSLADVKTFLQPSTGSVATVVGYNIDNPSLVFPLPYGMVSTFSGGIQKYNKTFATNFSGNKVTLISTEQFSDEKGDYFAVVTTAGGAVTKSPTLVVVSSGNRQVDLTFGDVTPVANSAVIVSTTLTKSVTTTKTKSIVSDFSETIAAAATINLTNADIIRVKSIVSSSIGDVTQYYAVDNGQRPTVYENGSLVAVPGFVVPSGNLIIKYDYFNHSVSGDYFVVDSYVGVDYGSIPSFVDDSGSVYALASCIDYRSKTNATGIAYSDTSSNAFVKDSEIITSFSYYLGRIDKIVLSSDGKFGVISGVPAREPMPPTATGDAMVLYQVMVNPWTFNTNDVRIDLINNRRYTMRDIGRIEDRLKVVEYYTALSLLESDTINRDITNKFRNGFIVDDFSDTSKSDITNPDNAYALDSLNRIARPPISTKFIQLGEKSGDNVVVNNGIATLKYSEVPMISQLQASVIARIQPYILYNWDGKMELSPSSDSWYTVTYAPNIVIDGGIVNVKTGAKMDEGLFGAWSNNWAGSVGQDVFDTRSGTNVQVNDGVWVTNTTTFHTFQNAGVSVEQVGDVHVTETTDRYIRSRTIAFTATGLKPHTRFDATFDGRNVNALCAGSGGSIGSPIISSGNGSVSGTFTIPNTQTNRFRTGARDFSLTAVTDVGEIPSSSATGTYTATGIVAEHQSTFISTRLVTDGVDRVVVDTRRLQIDPLAQSFMIEKEINGAFATSVDLYFGPEAASNTFSATAQIREMINGYPGPSIAPHSSITLPASSIVGSMDATVATRFTFKAPVFLENGKEYCFVVLSDSNVLTLWTAKLGEREILPGDTTRNSGQLIAKQAFLGSMYRSQNNTTWTADQLSDIKFVLNKAKFVSSGDATFINTVAVGDTNSEANPYRASLVNPFKMTLGDVNLKVTHRNHGMCTGQVVVYSNADITDFGIAATTINQSIGFVVTVTGIDNYNITLASAPTATGFGGGSVTASQQVEFSITYLLSEEIVPVKTRLEHSTQYRNQISFLGTATKRVPTRTDIQYPNPLVSQKPSDGSIKDLVAFATTDENLSPVIDLERFGVVCVQNRVDNVSLAQYIQNPVSLTNPANEVNVYVDVNRPSGTNIDVYYRASSGSVKAAPWILMVPSGPAPISNDETFEEYKYVAVGIPDYQNIQVKIVFRSNNIALVPRIKSLRTLALKGI